MAFDIDVGNLAEDRSATGSTSGYTDIDLANPANADGEITQIEIWARGTGSYKVGLCYLVSGTTYKCRSVADLGSITAGSKVTKAVSLEVKAGDFIAWYSAAGSIEYESSGGSGWRYLSGDHLNAAEQDDYSLASGYLGSCYGQGNTPATNVVLMIV